MNNDTNQPQGSPPTGGLGLPPLPSMPETPAAPPLPAPSIPAEPITPSLLPTLPEVPTPSEPLTEVKTAMPETLVVETTPVTTTTTTKIESVGQAIGLPSVEVKTETTGPVEKKPKRKINKKLAIGGTLVLLLLGGAIALAAQFGLFRGDIRQRASGGCPDGQHNSCSTCYYSQYDTVGYSCCSCVADTGGDTGSTTTDTGGDTGSTTTDTGGGCGGCEGGSIGANTGPYGCNSARGGVGYCGCNDWYYQPSAECPAGEATAAVTSGTTSGGGCAGDLSHPACKACGNPGPCTYLNTQGYCSVTTGNNCAWDFAQICSPGECVNAGGGTWRKCAASGSTWEGEYDNSSCSGGAVGGGEPTTEPTAEEITTSTTVTPTISGDATQTACSINSGAGCDGKRVGDSCTIPNFGGTRYCTQVDVNVGFPVCDCSEAETVQVTDLNATCAARGGSCTLGYSSSTSPQCPAGNDYIGSCTNSSCCKATVATTTALSCTCANGSRTGEYGPATCTNPTTGEVTTQPFRVDCAGQSGAIGGSGETGGYEREGVWGEFGVDCDRNTGTCSGNTVYVYSCSPEEIDTWAASGAPICLQGLWETSGSVNCVDIANQTCSFVQIDVVTDNPLSGSAMTCYPTVDCGSPATAPTATPSLAADLPAPQTTPGDNPNTVEVTESPTVTTEVTTTAPACVNTRIFINGSTTAATQEQMNGIRVGDTIRLAIRGNQSSFTKGRFVIKLDNTILETFETTTKQNLPGDVATFEFIQDYVITQGGNYAIEGSIWQ